MKIIYTDGSTLECCEIKSIDSLHLLADDIYLVNTDEIEKIVED